MNYILVASWWQMLWPLILTGVGALIAWGAKGLVRAIRNYIWAKTDKDVEELRKDVNKILKWINDHDTQLMEDKKLFDKLRRQVLVIIKKLKADNT